MAHWKNAELLLGLLRSHDCEATLRSLSSLSESEWHSLVDQSIRHQIAPMLYNGLTAIGNCVNTPSSVLVRLKRHYLLNTGRNLYIYSELTKLLRRLRGESIPVIVLKGAHLAKAVYRDIGMRFMMDADILLRRTDIAEAERILCESGYLRGTRYPEHDFHYYYMKDEKKYGVELHWNIHSETDQATNIVVEGLWERAEPMEFGGVEALVLSPEDSILYLCLHDAAHHFFVFGLRSFCDLYHSIERCRRPIDWDQLSRRSIEWRIQKSTYLTLHLLRKLLTVDVPLETLAALRPEGFSQEVLTWALQAIFVRGQTPLAISSNFARLWHNPRLKDRILVSLGTIFLPRDQMSALYPIDPNGPKVYFYYAWRMLDLCLRHGKSWRKRLRGDEGITILTEQKNSELFLMDWLRSD